MAVLSALPPVRSSRARRSDDLGGDYAPRRRRHDPRLRIDPGSIRKKPGTVYAKALDVSVLRLLKWLQTELGLMMLFICHVAGPLRRATPGQVSGGFRETERN